MNVVLQERSIVLTAHVVQMGCAITVMVFVFVTKDTKDKVAKVAKQFYCIESLSNVFR